jgi:glucose-6-phosphate isomerase
MSVIKLEMDNMSAPAAPRDVAWPGLEAFLRDMDADKSSFFHLPERSSWNAELARTQPELVKRLPEVDTFIHLGIGGSSLGAETIVRALAPATAPAFHFLDNIDPDYIWNVLEQTAPNRALLYVVSKSGTTMETLAQFAYLYQWLSARVGAEAAKNHLVFCTDPKKGDLRNLSQLWGVPCFEIPPNLGGRFSALSAVGLFPALVARIDCDQLLKGAREYRAHIMATVEKGQLPAVADLAYRLVQMSKENGRQVTVLMPYSQRLKALSAWFTQLWGESLGKNGKGITPVPATGATDQHSILQLLRDGPQDKVVGFVEISGFNHIIELKWQGPKLDSVEGVTGITLNQLIDAELNATRQVLTNNARPHFSVVLPRLNANNLGQLLYFLEVLTALTGYYLGVNPFDQPGVEEGKMLTIERIHACKKSSMA